jgi:Mce-associated membrane protein
MALTDLVDTGEVPASEDAEGTGSGTGNGRTSGRPIAYALLLLLFATSAILLILAIVERSDQKKPPATGSSADAQAALAAARTEALNIMTLDYRTAKRDLQRVIDGSTGQMHDQYAASASSLIATANSGKSVSTGTILYNGISYPKNQPSLSSTKAQVLVAGDATVKFAASKTSKASTLQVRYRFIFDMQKKGNAWKAALLNFAGLPAYSQVAS